MTVRFFRLTITGTDEAKLSSIEQFIDGKIEDLDIDFKCGYKLGISHDDIAGDYTLCLDMYIKSNVNLNKYKNFIVDRFSTLNKTGLTHAKIIQYDSCSHDEENPKPCKPTTRMEWKA